MSEREYFEAVAEAMRRRFGVLMPGWFTIRPQYRDQVCAGHASGLRAEACAEDLVRASGPQRAAA